MPALPIDTDQIVITASRALEAEAATPASVSIIDQQRIERLDEPLVAALLRLTPSAAIATSGPAGSLTEVRIRGAEANHSLLFVDGIKVNDPASGDAPRFELLNADLASRIEVVRGPQSALWGSEAIGGVIAVNGVDDAAGERASVEAGSFGFLRGTASAALVSSNAAVAGAVGFQRATGIDSFNGHGDKDGYRNLSGRLRASWRPAPKVEIGASGLALTGRTEFDGFDPVTFAHTDTLDSSRNRLGAARIWVDIGAENSPWRGQLAGSILGSSNRNFLAEVEQNRTRGERRNVSAQLERRFATGAVNHRLVAAADLERETFHARDTIYGGLSNQDRSRRHEALTFEWRAEARKVTADVAVRRDMFNRFKDATSLRASLLAEVGSGFSLAGSYGEGIAQPTFFDLYGFFPNNFAGNPTLKPESSRGFELSLRYRKGPVEAAVTAYRQRLHDEIIDVFDGATGLFSTANSTKISHRSGLEAGLGWQVGQQLRLSVNYAYLRATQPDDAALTQVHELRRPKHSGSVAFDGKSGSFTYGGSVAYVGSHLDQRDTFPFDRVTLGSYWLAGARLAYAIRPGIEVFGRISNALGQHYQDVFGYRTEPRAVYAGLKFSKL
ncbi:TonB-dependent receptor plug domain-containing protein [Sphingomonas agri]|uniref:TonB-dependent receptor plug domain-containing protein n=1 Tax=Sphingomonas agri TaxID=1813878 RepID=UPI00311DB57D